MDEAIRRRIGFVSSFMPSAAKEKIRPVFPLAAPPSAHPIGFVPSNLTPKPHQGSAAKSATRTRVPASVSPTSHWGCALYSYDFASARLVYPNGLQSTFSYDDLNRLKSLNGYQYQLGLTGNRQSATEPNGRSLAWTYDGIYRLTNETISLDPMSKNGTVAYGLDPVGNRLSQTASIPGIPTTGFSYDADDRILSTESYDANGNTTVFGSRTFTYDFANRLKSMNGGAVTLVYDGDGNRAAKTVGGATTRYLVDNLNPTGYAQVVEEVVGGAVQRTYTYGLQRINQNQPSSGTWTPSFYGYDGFGSVRQLTNSSGAVTDTYDYDAWGNAVNTTGSTPSVYLYRGERYDSDLVLYYLRARYFNPLSGRFLTRDPEGGDASKPVTLHRYLYAGADAVNKTDPTGRNMFETGELMEIDLGATPFAHAVGVAIVRYWCYAITALSVADYAITGGKEYGPPSIPKEVKFLCGLVSLRFPPKLPESPY